MITKYDMASGESTYQTRKNEPTEALVPRPFELVELIPSLQLVEITIQPEPSPMPPDMASISIAEFLLQRG